MNAYDIYKPGDFVLTKVPYITKEPIKMRIVDPEEYAKKSRPDNKLYGITLTAGHVYSENEVFYFYLEDITDILLHQEVL